MRITVATVATAVAKTTNIDLNCAQIILILPLQRLQRLLLKQQIFTWNREYNRNSPVATVATVHGWFFNNINWPSPMRITVATVATAVAEMKKKRPYAGNKWYFFRCNG